MDEIDPMIMFNNQGGGFCDIFGVIHLISHQIWKKQVTHKKIIFNVFLNNLSCIQKKNEEKRMPYTKDMAVFLKGEFRITNVAGLHTFLSLAV